MTRGNIFFVLALVILCFCSCSNKNKLTIAFSYPNGKSNWGNLLLSEVNTEILLYSNYNIDLITKDAQRDKQKQKEDLKEFLNENIDALLLCPMDTSLYNQEIEAFLKKGIPVIIIDSRVNTSEYTSFIGQNNKNFGIEAAKYTARLLNKKGSVLMVVGNPNSATAKQRSCGFIDEIAKYPDVEMSDTIIGYWSKEITLNRLDKLFSTGYKPDLVYAHNDVMAHSAHLASKKHNISPFIIGIDALNTHDGGINLVYEGAIDMTLFNRPEGGIAIQHAIAAIEGKEVPKETLIETFPIDKNNVYGIKESIDLATDQLKNVYELEGNLLTLSKRYKKRQLIIFVSIITICLFLAFSIALFRYFKQKQKYISIITKHKKQISEHLDEEQCLLEELTTQNESLELYKNKLETLVKERTKMLEEALKKAEESDQLKTSFLNNFSHEVRTPLNSIIGFSNILGIDPDNKEENDLYLRNIRRGGNELLKLINDLLEVSVISTEEIKLTHRAININSLILESYKLCQIENADILQDKSENLSFEYNVNGDMLVSTDITRIKQLLGYLINNAIKFTHNGKVELGYQFVKEEGKVRIYVKDSGIGIDSKFVGEVFKKFIKLENKNNMYRGIGIGLYIAQYLANKLGTMIQFDSYVGKGSTFYLELPIYKNAKPHKSAN